MASSMTVGHFLISLNLTDYEWRAGRLYNDTKREYQIFRRALMAHFPDCVGDQRLVQCREPLIDIFDRRLRISKTLTRQIIELSRTDVWREDEETKLDDSQLVHSVKGVIVRAERAILIIAAAIAALVVAAGVGMSGYAIYAANQNSEELRRLQSQVNALARKDALLENAIIFNNRTLQIHEKQFRDTFQITSALANETQSIRDVRYLGNRITMHFNQANDLLRDMKNDLSQMKLELQKGRCSDRLLTDEQTADAFYKFTNRTRSRNLTPVIDHPEEMRKLPASFIGVNGTIIIDVGVPAYDNQTSLRVLNWLKFPLLETPDRIITPISTETVIAINQQTDLHRILTQNQLEQCDVFKQVYLCPDQNVLTDDFTASCLEALYQQDLDTIVGLCPLQSVRPKILIRQLTEETFVVFSPKQLGKKMHPIECPTGFNLSTLNGKLETDIPAFITTEPGFVKIRIPRGCKARIYHSDNNKQTLLWSNPTFVQRINVSAPSIDQVVNVSFLMPMQTPKTKVWSMLAQFYEPPKEFDDIRPYLHVNSVEKEWNRTQESWIETWWKPTTWSTLGGTAAVALITIILIIVFCTKSRKSLETQGRTASNINISIDNQSRSGSPAPTHNLRAPTPYVQIPNLVTSIPAPNTKPRGYQLPPYQSEYV